MQYKKDFKDHKKHDLLVSALGRFFGKELGSEFVNTSLIGVEREGVQRTESDFQEANYTFNLDYTKPFSKEITVETGAQYLLQDVGNDYKVSDVNLSNGVETPDPNLTNNFEWLQKVFGVYATAAYEGKKYGLKLGLRLENTDLETLQEADNQRNDQNYTNFFPTVHTSYKFTERFSVQEDIRGEFFVPGSGI